MDFARRFWDAAYREDDDREHWSGGLPERELDALVGPVWPAEAPDRRALDLGCGTSDHARRLRARGLPTLGADLSVAALARRRADRGPTPAGVAATAFRLPFPTGVFSHLLDSGLFHHVGSASRGLYAREIVRVLRSDGRILIRGAAERDEEAGLVGVAPADHRWFEPELRLLDSWATTLPAPAGDLAGRALLLVAV